MFHCHLDFHAEVGMGILIKIGDKKDLPSEPLNWPKCGNYFYTEFGSMHSALINAANNKTASCILDKFLFFYLIYKLFTNY